MARKADAAKRPAAKKPASRAKTTTKVKTVSAKPATKTTVKSKTPVVTRPVVADAEPRRRTVVEQITDVRMLGSLVAEFFGTFLLAGAVLVLQGNALYVMFALLAIYLSMSALSGGYYNPAFAVAGWVTKRLSAVRAVGYILAQVLGAVLAFVVVSAFVGAAPEAQPSMMSMGGPAEVFKAPAIPEGKEWFILAGEMIGMAIFAFAAASLRDKVSDTARAWTLAGGLMLGLAVTAMPQVGLAALVGGTAVLNPAIAGALQALNFNAVWPIAIYVVASTLAAVLAFALHDFLARATRA